MAKLSRVYQRFAGVDFSNNEVALNRSPDSLNMWKDYKDSLGHCVQTRPDLTLDTTYATPVYGIFFYKVNTTTYKIVHTGTTLYSNGVSIFASMNPTKTQFFVFNNLLYIKDGINYLVYNGTTCSAVVGYVPTTNIGRKPAGGGTPHEDVNMLSDFRINTFRGDGASVDYFLDVPSIDSGYTEIVKVDDVPLIKGTDFTTNTATGKITFVIAPAKPLTDGADNVSIQYKKAVSGYADRIKKCSLSVVFDNRIFFAGNGDYPNVLFHSSYNNPTYCSDLDYYNEGTDLTLIKALIPAEDSLWVIKEPTQTGNSIYFHRPTIDSSYGKIYPSQYSNISYGCVGAGINFNDSVTFFSENGMEVITGNVNQEQISAHRSSLVDGKMLKESGYNNMLLEEYAGYLLVIIGTKVYLADSRQMFQDVWRMEHEWFYWEFPKAVVSTRVYNNVLYIGTADGIYTLNSTPTNLTSYWTTPIDDFGATNLRKTTDKRGGLVDMSGTEITLSTKTDNNAFKTIATYTNTKGYVVFKAKEKKFKGLQLKFSSTKPFKLYTASIEAYIGSYVKR